MLESLPVIAGIGLGHHKPCVGCQAALCLSRGNIWLWYHTQIGTTQRGMLHHFEAAVERATDFERFPILVYVIDKKFLPKGSIHQILEMRGEVALSLGLPHLRRLSRLKVRRIRHIA